MGWHTVNTISGPCKCGKGMLSSTHLADENNNFETIWNLNCPDCKKKYRLVETVLEGNPDKSISMVRYIAR